jgi:DNA polymerase-3 subunit delta'
LGHDDVVDRFRRILARGRLASTFLFVGPDGIGKRTFALKLAQALLCAERPEEALDPCGRCESCVQAAAGTHPDILTVAKPLEKSELPVALFIGTKEKRMQEGLCHDLALKPFFGRRRVAVIDDADYLNEEGANCLLKTLEEPPPRSLLILVGASLERQLPTIRSRCQTVRFAPLDPPVIAELLLAEDAVTDRALAERLAAWSEGSLARARDMADPELWKFRQVLLARLSEADLDSVRFAEAIGKFVDEAGTDAFRRRNRLRQVIGFAAEFYRQLARSLAGAAANADAQTQQAIAAAQRSTSGGAEAAANRLDRCLEALGHVDRNANQSALIAAWIDDLVWRDRNLAPGEYTGGNRR